MLKWNKDKERYESVKNKKFSRHDIMGADEEIAYRFMAGTAFMLLLITITMLVQSC
tara:strand:- start:1108 stop:1275 length:168 start_codon:yes stop_codon:yes gene_type:complete